MSDRFMPTWRIRIRAAGRILFLRGAEAFVCSFCGIDRHKVDSIVAGPGVNICGECARIAAVFARQSNQPPVPIGRKSVIVTPVIVQPERLAEDRVASVPDVIRAAAQDAGCTLLEWTLTHKFGEGSDHLDLCVECDSGTDETALRNRLITACRQALDMAEVDDRYLSAVGAGAPAATPSE